MRSLPGEADTEAGPPTSSRAMERFEQIPRGDYDLAGHLARKYGERPVGTADGFCVWTSLASDRPYLVRSLDVVELASGERIGHIQVSATGRVKITPGCSCRPSASEAIAGWEAARPAGRR